MTNTDFLSRYEKELSTSLAAMLHDLGALEGATAANGDPFIGSPDIDDRWLTIVQAYAADAVPEVAKYPLVSLGWAMYVGMAVAKFWDSDWTRYGQMAGLYEYVRDQRGFDYLDEVVRQDILGLRGKDFERMERLVQSASEHVLTRIRRANVEPATQDAYYVFLTSVHTLYRAGAAVVLEQLGYHLSPQQA